ncbi:unnamed protein product [Cylindrotheca closterium]|uniref:Uncharacterized protein n=1 Tax=Cylindrotheca closterium TaxID=2856 RepID=A0AAD2CRD3_9STRA|nr:unnamed protein product [Cylindrotheca closterium]
MEVVNNLNLNESHDMSDPDEGFYPIKSKKPYSRNSEYTERTERCSDFSDFSPEGLGEIGFAFKDNNNDSARTRSTASNSTRLSLSGRYDFDIQNENEELKSELSTVKAERDSLKTQVSVMSLEMARLREQLRLKAQENKAAPASVQEPVAAAATVPAVGETSQQQSPAVKRGSLLGRIFKRKTSKQNLMVEDDEELPLDISLIPTNSAPESPKKRRSMLKRIFSGKGKDLESIDAASEFVSDADGQETNEPQEEQEEGQEGTVQYVDWKRDPLPQDQEEPAQFSRVTMAGFMNSISEEEPVQDLEWKRDPLEVVNLPKVQEEDPVHAFTWKRMSTLSQAVMDEDSDMDSVDEPLTLEPTSTISTIVSAEDKTQQEPIHHIQWKRVPATLIFQWKRIPSTRRVMTIPEDEPVQYIKWERVPVIPTIDIKWERVPVTPTINIKWERIPSTRVMDPVIAEDEAGQDIKWERVRSIPTMPKDAKPVPEIHWYREPARTHTVQWARVTAPASPQKPNKPILKSALKSALKTNKFNNKPKSAVKSAGFSTDEPPSAAASAAPKKKRGVMIRESINEVNRVSKIRGSAWDNCFFTEEELGDFKYAAFLEECGLTEEDF